MYDILMHIVRYHKHGDNLHYLEGITEYYLNDEHELIKTTEGVFYTCWGN
jgi:hypothetical protein